MLTPSCPLRLCSRSESIPKALCVEIYTLCTSSLMHRTLVAQRADILLDVCNQTLRPTHNYCRLTQRLLERAADDLSCIWSSTEDLNRRVNRELLLRGYRTRSGTGGSIGARSIVSWRAAAARRNDIYRCVLVDCVSAAAGFGCYFVVAWRFDFFQLFDVVCRTLWPWELVRCAISELNYTVLNAVVCFGSWPCVYNGW